MKQTNKSDRFRPVFKPRLAGVLGVAFGFGSPSL